MIEIVYNKEKENAVGNEEYFCVPRNIRQIGNVPKEHKIYLEDYVYTYLTTDWKEEEAKGRIAILLGKYNWKNGASYIFIKSAVSVENISVYRDHYPLTDDVWGTIYEEMKTYFPGQEVVGWYLSLPDGGMRITDGIVQTHLKHFGGNDKVLLLSDPYEKESVFYLYKNNQMECQKGYYVFYEKNDQMQEYMLLKNPDAGVDFSGKVQDRAVKDFRKIAAKKLEEKSDKRMGVSWVQVACAGFVVVWLAAGTLWLRSQNEDAGQMESANAKDASVLMDETDMQDGSGEQQEMVLLTPEDGEIPMESGDLSQESTQSQQETEPLQEDQAQSQQGDGQLQEGQMQPQQGLEQSQDSQMQSQQGSGQLQEDQAQSQQDAEQTSISVYTKYTVRSGDTLSKISMRYYGDFSKITDICKINNLLEEDVIYPGQTILLP